MEQEAQPSVQTLDLSGVSMGKLVFPDGSEGVLAARAWQHLVWDAPFRTFLWSEDYLKAVVEGRFHLSWQQYVSSPATDAAIQGTIRGFGVFYALGIAQACGAFCYRDFSLCS